MFRQGDRHVGRRKKALRYLNHFSVALRNEILQRTYAIDDHVRLAVGQRVKSFRQILVFGVWKMHLVEILRTR